VEIPEESGGFVQIRAALSSHLQSDRLVARDVHVVWRSFRRDSKRSAFSCSQGRKTLLFESRRNEIPTPWKFRTSTISHGRPGRMGKNGEAVEAWQDEQEHAKWPYRNILLNAVPF